MNQYYPHLFEPFTIKKTTFRNHIFSAPNMMCHMDANGFPTDYMIAYYAEKAKGGAAVVTVGDTPVDHEHGAIESTQLQPVLRSAPIHFRACHGNQIPWCPCLPRVKSRRPLQSSGSDGRKESNRTCFICAQLGRCGSDRYG